MSLEHLIYPDKWLGGKDAVAREMAARRQNDLLKLLRSLGVTEMIEQQVGIKIPPLVFEDDPDQPSKVDLIRTLRMGTAQRFPRERVWNITLMPRLDDKSSFDDTLRIKATKFQDLTREEGTHKGTFSFLSVSIEFAPDKHLQVVGGKTTVDENLSSVNSELQARVQTGINEAFKNPKTISGEPEVYSAVTPK